MVPEVPFRRDRSARGRDDEVELAEDVGGEGVVDVDECLRELLGGDWRAGPTGPEVIGDVDKLVEDRGSVEAGNVEELGNSSLVPTEKSST
jgi:hypothetical protein